MSAKDDIAAYLAHLDTGGVGIDQIIFDELAPIVRCRDCQMYDPSGEPSSAYPDRHWCDKLWRYMPPDGFCSWGERRDA